MAKDRSVTTPVITVAICTYRRAESLRCAIDSLLMQTLPKSDFRILIVDNAPDAADLDSLRADYPASGFIGWCHEPPQGLSGARNRAIGIVWRESVGLID